MSRRSDRPKWSSPIESGKGIKAHSKRGAFAENWWAQRWIEALERVTDAGRLRRGQSYARKGQVLSIDEQAGIGTGQANPDLVDIDRPELRMHAYPQDAALAAHADVQPVILPGPEIHIDTGVGRVGITPCPALREQGGNYRIAPAATAQRVERQAKVEYFQATTQTLDAETGLGLDIHEQIGADAANMDGRIIHQGTAVLPVDANTDT